MKKITLLLFLVTSFCFSQTTLEEYNYITKGYKIAIDSGLDLKSGYSLHDLYVYQDPLYVFDFKLFINDKTKKTSCVFVKANSLMWGNKYYLCIPIDNPELNKKYESQLNSWDKAILSSYSLALSNILSMSLKEADE